MARLAYDDSDAALTRPLDEAEVDVILAGGGRGFARDARLVMHFVQRAKVTIIAYRRQLQALQRSVDEFNITRRASGHPVEVAIAALAALDDSGRRRVFDRQVLTALAKAEEAEAAAERARIAGRSEGNRVRFALASVLDDPTVPAEVKGRIHRAMQSLPKAGPAPARVNDTVRRVAAGPAAGSPPMSRGGGHGPQPSAPAPAPRPDGAGGPPPDVLFPPPADTDPGDLGSLFS